jgi:hypothetical protein
MNATLPALSLGSKDQRDLQDALIDFERGSQLPDVAEIEPGAFLHLVHRAWTDVQRRDGRRGHLSDQELASLISARIHRPFTRNQYLSAFGDGRRSRDDSPLRYKTGIPRDVAAAYLRIAFDNWALKPPGSADKFAPLLVEGRNVSDTAINNACRAMFDHEDDEDDSREAERVVYCREAPGLGVRSFYRECGHHARSVIVTTTRDAFVMGDVGRDLTVWEDVLRALFEPDHTYSNQASESIHVWALKEPWITDDRRSYKSLMGLTNLQGLLRLELALHKGRAAAPASDVGMRSRARLWPLIEQRCIVAVKLHPSNDALRGDDRDGAGVRRPGLIADEFIFPNAVPQEWTRRGVSAGTDELISVVTVDGHSQLTYNGFAPIAQDRKRRAIIQVPPPSAACSLAFLMLHRACVAFRHPSKESKTILEEASAEGWRFFSPTEFIDLPLPVPGNPTLPEK